ncbi:hypothetical protein NM208_g7171 [Fusarium decemcellulare]|uniref:Uncharacterized protein n=1 Tax=Fusarium decemcellulare TaxID=57161 RepID=A0ACC1SA52_9HYPO|nr:hypothetical protein NM208_g7171 [Fusarium decemcellulare]
MAFPKLAALSVLVAGIAIFIAPSIRLFTTVVGVFRQPSNTEVAKHDFVTIPDTIHCEDMHHHLPSGLIFTACQDSNDHFTWFPPLVTFDDPVSAGQSRGSIHVIDPKSFTSKRLEFDNFDGPFITHGIDVISDPDASHSVYIIAVNHPPHPQYLKHIKDGNRPEQYPRNLPKAASQIEIFHHVLGTSSVKHVRSVSHPLIKTPNDILAVSPSTFYVTNDHYYTEGRLRFLETAYFGAKWSTTLLVKVADLYAKEPTSAVQATVAVTGLHNNNGLGRGKTPDEMLIGSAASGALHFAQIGQDSSVQIVQTVQLDYCVDNPTFYRDPFAELNGDSSGYVLAGLSRGIDISKTTGDTLATEPVMIWMVKPQGSAWEKKLLFEDDGQRLRSGTTAILIGISPELEEGKKKAWLFATGFYSQSIIAVKINL